MHMRQFQIPLETVAGVAQCKCPTSNISRITVVNAIRSLLASVNTLLSSISVFKLSIHIGSMSPSRIIHLGLSAEMFAWSRINDDSRPSFHSRVAGLTKPNNSLLVTLFGFKSLTLGRFSWLTYVANRVFHISDLPVPALPTINTEWRTVNSSSNWTTWGAKVFQI